MKRVGHLDLEANQIQDVSMEQLTAHPTGYLGRFYYNTVDKKMYIHDGTNWTSGTIVLMSIGTGQPIVVANGTDYDFKSIAAKNNKVDVATVNNTIEVGVNESNIDHDALANYDVNQHRIINDAGTSITELWSANKINSELTAIANAATGALLYKGSYNAATNSPNLEAGTGVKTGFTYVVSTAGDFFTEGVQPGDMLVANKDNPSVLGDWMVVNKNIPDIVSASITDEGIIQIASNTEVVAGINALKSVTPASLQHKLDQEKYTRKKVISSITIGDSAGEVTLTHNLGTTEVAVSCHISATGEEVGVDINSRQLNTVKIQGLGADTVVDIIIIG